MLGGRKYSQNLTLIIQSYCNFWSISTFILAATLICPFIALILLSTGDSEGLWDHLLATVVPRYTVNTLFLMTGVGFFSLLFGISTAWIIARFKFPCSKILEWSLLLPCTVPSYIIAYTYTDLLEYAGPVQSLLRDIFSWSSAQDYWFPEIRSMGGAILVMSSVLFPYIYLLARTSFRETSRSYFELTKLHRPSSKVFIDIALARPAIIAGLSLVLMEVLSDFGTVEYFAVETITLGIFNVWLGMNNLVAASQIAGLAFIFIISLILIERWARKRQRFTDTTKSKHIIKPIYPTKPQQFLCIIVCFLPILLGFIIPISILLNFVLKGFSIVDFENLRPALYNSLLLSSAVAIIVMMTSWSMVITITYKKQRILGFFSTLSTLGYAFPGAILAIGVVSFAGFIDKFSEYAYQETGIGLFNNFLIGGIILLVIACVVRFQAVGHGAIFSGIQKLSPNIMEAAVTLNRSFSASVLNLSPPLLSKSILAGSILVFVDVMKELPMTLLLRPFNYETLATYVYQFAKDELLEETALAAIIIIFAGLGPIILLNKYQQNSNKT